MGNSDLRVDVSVILPCLNEAESVRACVEIAARALRRAGLSHEVIVADNGSTDASAYEATLAKARVVAEGKRGYGAAIRAGVDASRGHTLVIVDADGTYPVEHVAELVKVAQESKGLVLGSRFTGTIAPRAMSLTRRLLGTPATRLILRSLFKVRASDPHSGMRCLSREAFDRIRPRSSGMASAIEMLVMAKRCDIPILELPISYGRRVGGQSKLSPLRDGVAMIRLLFAMRVSRDHQKSTG